MALEAIDDFDHLLRTMCKASLDVDGFRKLMASVGYKGDSTLIFQQLAGSIDASLDTSKLINLYSSPTYATCYSNEQTGRRLMTFIKLLFREADINGSGLLQHDQLKVLLRTLLSIEDNSSREEKKADEVNSLSDLLLNEMAGEILARNGNDKGANLEQLASVFLRYSAHQEESVEIHGFDSETLNPFLRTPEEFVLAVEKYVVNHNALDHHLLDSIQKGVYGDDTVSVVAHFLEAYRYFTRNFCTYLEGCIGHMTKKDHVELLTENEEEENGNYEDDDIEMMVKLGLDPDVLKGVSHKHLFVGCIDNLKKVSQIRSEDPEVLQDIADSVVTAFNGACIGPCSTAESSIAAMYFSSEFLVPTLYTKLSAFLDQDTRLNRMDLAFFVLHIDMDVEHADQMRKIVIDLAGTEAQRRNMINAVAAIMDARVNFYDKFVQYFFPPTGHGGTASSSLYNNQSNNWVRKTANCLSDFTGRPIIFDMCEPHVHGALVLDVGCGEGYAGRKFMRMGATAVTGVDVSSEMVARACENAISEDETYLVGDASSLKKVIESNPAAIGIVPGVSTEAGCFDLAVGIFVFNYTSIFDMNRICQQVYQVLKPGGHFVFSVPHPFMLNAHPDDEDTFAFQRGDANASSYFSLRDRKFSGTIKTLDGRVLNVKMCFKAISDYFDAVAKAGFELSGVHEARVLPEHVAEHPEFFKSVKDSPLHLIFKVQKPEAPSKIAGPLAKFPKKIRWLPYHFQNPEAAFVVDIPEEAKASLKSVVISLMSQGITASSYDLNAIDKEKLEPLCAFAGLVRRKITGDIGGVLVRGLKDAAQGSEEAAKLAYYLFASLVGTVDGSARGRLFDVRDTNLSTNNDNVLFSVSNAEATWHTDGASVNRSYDVVSLFCINPAPVGGEIRVSNAVNAIESLKSRIPKFLLYELMRPLPRDVMENGSGEGRTGDILLDVSRSPKLLQLRVQNNSYPIVVEQDDGMRFRYMRYWIETGHAKAGLTMSPLLSVAMDLLDQALDESQLWEGRMQSGDVLFCNNMLLAHARRSFANTPDQPPRHKLRAWLQM